jgi:hypothetical protein
MSTKSTIARLSAAMAGGLFLCAASSAQVAAIELRIDLRDDTIATTSEVPGNWNDIGSVNGVTAGLIDFGTGLATPVSISGSGWQPFFLGVVSPADWPEKDWVHPFSTTYGAGLFVGDAGQTGTFSFSGLSDTARYQVEVVSARTRFDYLSTILVDGAVADRTFNGTPVNTPWGATSDGLIPQNWLIWDDLIATGGMLSLSVAANPETGDIINAIRIIGIEQATAVSEPASAAILLIGLVGLGVLRRRKKSA